MDEKPFNILVAPWPLEIDQSQFVSRSISDETLPDGFGYFEYKHKRHRGSPKVERWLKRAIDECDEIGQEISLIIFPELSLTNTEYEAVVRLTARKNISLIAGVGVGGKSGRHGQNKIRCNLIDQTGISVEFEQHKHHRWKLDGRQIQRYGLSGTLVSTKNWWESCQISKRELKFFAMSEDIVLCALICEDLARQEPVADLVRAVGPNLVIALLMDGPQIPSRWPACYASVLADDPGSSVLTVTNFGMVKRASISADVNSSHAVALWKDALGNFQPIIIPAGHQAAVLNIHIKRETEWTADDRDDEEVAARPFLSNHHFLKVFGQ